MEILMPYEGEKKVFALHIGIEYTELDWVQQFTVTDGVLTLYGAISPGAPTPALHVRVWDQAGWVKPRA
jgi:hypothetical protein